MIVRNLVALSLIPAALTIGGSGAIAQSDPRLVTQAYDETDIVKLHGRMGVQATIAFADDEKIENVAVGDSQKWQITPNKRANLLFAKPLDPAATTNMTVVTDKRTYLFDLVASLKERPVYMLRFTYGGDRTVLVAAEPPREPAPVAVNIESPVATPLVAATPAPVVEPAPTRVVVATPVPETVVEIVPPPELVAASDRAPVAEIVARPALVAQAPVDTVEPAREAPAPLPIEPVKTRIEPAPAPLPQPLRLPKNAIDAAIVESSRAQPVVLAQVEVTSPARPAPDLPSPVGTVVEPGTLNFAWSRGGASSLLPRRIFDDGRATYLTWGVKQTVPTVLVAGADGVPVPVGKPADGQSLVIDSVPNRIVLRGGGLTASLENMIQTRAIASRETGPVPSLAEAPTAVSSN